MIISDAILDELQTWQNWKQIYGILTNLEPLLRRTNLSDIDSECVLLKILVLNLFFKIKIADLH